MAGVPVRVLIADNEQLAAAGTTAALNSGDGFELVGVAADAARAAELAEAENPDVALVNAQVRGGGDDAVARSSRRRRARTCSRTRAGRTTRRSLRCCEPARAASWCATPPPRS